MAWVAVLAVMAFILLYQNDADHNHTRLKATLYFPLQRTVWALCLCWISYACMAGYGFFVDTILSLDTFQILSKVTYSTYLIQSTTIAVHVVFMRAHPILDTFDTVRRTSKLSVKMQSAVLVPKQFVRYFGRLRCGILVDAGF